ncbi:hypothetical protein PUMCH_003580 [Australozyma saopauloensis]|uniref:Kinetochore protein SPC25 n=1 Tax=Australozyma saopauloensis TaxID=291208 RepID=A0AAX4HCH0_9ASCO|nr:hypothetical protein PUMCH_003580 [[Candida] saopauloensis]
MLPFYSGKLSFEEFLRVKEEMQELSVQFQDYASLTYSALHKAKQQHILATRELALQRKKLKDEEALIKSQNEQNKATREANLNSLHVKQEKVAALATQLQNLKNTKKALENEIDEAKFDTTRLERSFSEVQQNMIVQNRKDNEELAKYEAYMGLQVEAVANDHLKFKFLNAGGSSTDEEIFFHLYVGGEDYKIGESSPALSAEQTSILEADLNSHGEIMLFLKKIRSVLKTNLRKS